MANLKFNFSKLFESKSLGFLFLGIVLYLGSSYLNVLKGHSANFGVYLSIFIILIASISQIVNWFRYWQRNKI